MDPHEVAPILGMSANGVAALSYRAREGLRKAWLQAHINDAAASGECRWAISKFGEHARQSLNSRDSRRVDAHLESCTRCAILCQEVDEVGSRLALVMIPILLGGVAGGSFLSEFAQSGAASLTAAAAPSMPAAVVTGSQFVGASAGAVMSSVGAGMFPIAVAGSLAAVVALAGSLVLLGPQGSAPENGATASESQTDQTSTSASDSVVDDNLGGGRRDAADATVQTPPGIDFEEVSSRADGTLVGDPGGALVGDLVGGLVDSVLGTVTGAVPPAGHTAPGGVVSADIDLSLVGTATPGAHLSPQGAGLVYATTTVSSSGTFVLTVTGIPGGLSSLDLVQTVDRNYLSGLVGTGGGLLGGLLGTVDGLINDLIKPLVLSSGSNQGIAIGLIG